nr:expressed protein [Hymenolepis microstoma]
MSGEGKGLKALFEKIDKDGSGKIDKEELKKALGEDNISEDMIRKLFQKYDINKDNLLDVKELIAFFKENKLYENFCKERMK